MATTPQPSPEDVAEIKALLIEHEGKLEGKLDKKYQTQEEAAAGAKAIEAKIVADNAAIEAKIDKRFADFDTKAERRMKELSARPQGIVAPSDDEVCSLGARFVDTAQYKAWAAIEGRTRDRLQLALKGVRIRPSLETKATITEAGSGYPMTPTRVGHFAPPTPPLGVRDLVTVVSLTSGNSVEYVVETWAHAADYQLLEGDKKAQSDVTYVDKTATVRTIAHFVKVSRQMLADAPYFASTVDNQLLYGVAKKEEHELLHGDGLAGHLHGLMPQATALPVDVLAGITYSADQILAAIAYLQALGYTPTGIVLNPIDWASIQIEKTATGIYILGGPPSGNASSTLWGLPVVSTVEMTAGSFLVGAFPPNATLFDRESPSVDVAYENEDDFVRNLVTMRCEERIVLAVYRPTAFVKGDIVPTITVGTAGAGAREGRLEKK
jgi:HK97 family phage major capsid protein